MLRRDRRSGVRPSYRPPRAGQAIRARSRPIGLDSSETQSAGLLVVRHTHPPLPLPTLWELERYWLSTRARSLLQIRPCHEIYEIVPRGSTNR